MKKVLLFGAAVLVGIGLATTFGDQEKVENTVESTQQISAPKEKKEEVITPSSSEEEVEPDSNSVVSIVLDLLEDSFSDVGTVHYDETQGAYIIIPTDPSFIKDVEYTLESGDTSSWNSLVDGFIELSNNITEAVGAGTSIAIANPVKTSNVILVITDGVVVYDAVNESVNQ